jgi:hypothetical protein
VVRTVKHTETELVLRSGPFAGWIGAGLSALMAFLAAWDASLSGWEADAVCGALLFTTIALTVLLVNSTETYTIGKTTGYLTTETKTLWKKLAQTGQYPIHEIAVVVLNQDRQRRYSLALGLKSGDTAPLRSSRLDNLLKIAEQMNAFLRVPLVYTIPDVKHPLRATATIVVLPIKCAGCNAPLPSIHQGTDSVTCDHCGTAMVVAWDQDGLPALTPDATPRESSVAPSG